MIGCLLSHAATSVNLTCDSYYGMYRCDGDGYMSVFVVDQTPLHVAVGKADVAAVAMLIQRGAYCNAFQKSES